MDYLLVTLRLIHIVGGIVWVGSAVAMYAFVGPALLATQEAGRQVQAHLMTRTRFSAAMTGSAVLTVLAGIALLARDAGAGPGWIRSGAGMTFSIGGAFGIVGLILGMLVGMTMGALGRLTGSIHGQPTAQQSADLARLQRRLSTLNPLNFYTLLVAAVLMAVARYVVL